jgi:hypothetical protein
MLLYLLFQFADAAEAAAEVDVRLQDDIDTDDYEVDDETLIAVSTVTKIIY